MARIQERLTYANVMSTIAVFIALGAGAYAAGLAKNSVKSKQIKAGAVKKAELANNAVTAPKVANGSLRSEDFGAGQLPVGAQGAEGPQGPEGPQGLEGTAGTARAYAHVDSNSCDATAPFACDFSAAKGVAGVTRPFVGRYCIDVPGIDAQNTPAAVTVDWQTTPGPEGNTSAMLRFIENATTCASPTQFQVQTERQPTVAVRNAADNGSTTVTGVADLSDNVAFTIVIP